MAKPKLIDPAALDMTARAVSRELLRSLNPHRHEMALMHEIISLDQSTHVVVGLCLTTPEAFWARGHMPGFPLMPGVLQLEAAAQLCAFYYKYNSGNHDVLLGLGGFDEVRFRGIVRPGDILMVVAKAIKLDRRTHIFETQGFVGSQMCFEARVMGVPLPGNDQVKYEPYDGEPIGPGA